MRNRQSQQSSTLCSPLSLSSLRKSRLVIFRSLNEQLKMKWSAVYMHCRHNFCGQNKSARYFIVIGHSISTRWLKIVLRDWPDFSCLKFTHIHTPAHQGGVVYRKRLKFNMQRETSFIFNGGVRHMRTSGPVDVVYNPMFNHFMFQLYPDSLSLTVSSFGIICKWPSFQVSSKIGTHHVCCSCVVSLWWWRWWWCVCVCVSVRGRETSGAVKFVFWVITLS